MHISQACKATSGMSLTAFGHGSVTAIDGRELTRTDTWGSGVEMICILHILASKYAAGPACNWCVI